ncbi:basic salivary proline-rich protein 2-like [Homarus americanus]|uniref:basic salivary proline-rich protein 2-like n=1 Tax=Homarus americanus TaxID=6706 RepID=UPI001C48B793|nr:basic salivary proline-rich protein 2-like [Homarus americanus]
MAPQGTLPGAMVPPATLLRDIDAPGGPPRDGSAPRSLSRATTPPEDFPASCFTLGALLAASTLTRALHRGASAPTGPPRTPVPLRVLPEVAALPVAAGAFQVGGPPKGGSVPKGPPKGGDDHRGPAKGSGYPRGPPSGGGAPGGPPGGSCSHRGLARGCGAPWSPSKAVSSEALLEAVPPPRQGPFQEQ